MKNDSRYIILDVVSPKEDFYRTLPLLGLVVALIGATLTLIQAMVACVIAVAVGLLLIAAGLVGMSMFDERYLLDADRRELLFVSGTRGKTTTETVCGFDDIIGVRLSLSTIYRNKRSYPAHGLDLKRKDGSTIAVLTPARNAQGLCQAKKREVQKMLGLRD